MEYTTYTASELRELISKAMQSGFNDDVAYWTKLLNELEGKK